MRDNIECLDGKRVDPGKNYVDWAVRMLSQGHDTPSLVDLAGLDLDGYPIDHSRAEMLLQQSLSELGIGPYTTDEILRTWLGQRAKQISDGLIDPIEGVDLIHDEVVGPLGHPADLEQWCYASSGFFVGEDNKITEFSDEEWPKELIEFAKQWAVSESLLDDLD